jgi:hypothetical protein
VRRLILPFFLIGWFGPHCEWLFRDASPFARPSLIATVVTALMAALVGWRLGRQRRGRWGRTVIGLPLLCGAVNGAILAALIWTDPDAIVAATLFGLFYACLYLVPMWVLCYAHFEIDDRRALWWGTQLLLLLNAVLCGLTGAASIDIAGPGAAVVVAGVVGVTVLLLDSRALRRLRNRRPEPLVLGPYREAPVTPVVNGTERTQVRGFLYNGLLLLAGAMIWACSGWLPSPR